MTLNGFELESQCSKPRKLVTKKLTKKLNKDFRLRKREKALSTFYSFSAEKVDCGITAKSELSEIRTKLAATKPLKIAQNCTRHKLCQKRRAKRQINKPKKQELAKSAKQARYFAEKLKLLRSKKSRANDWRKKRHL